MKRHEAVFMIGMSGLAEVVIFTILMCIAAGAAFQADKPLLGQGFIAAGCVLVAVGFFMYLTPPAE